eukprot:CAMPEP_0115268104 /NCGR_PEP_ID=MMETSP0270-20121206/52340_1 /TAXON_ID=71861 /ORGANISM="Scrippsiella trochoidea, Strain CCMP3099" /LENGTH=145 /DNA_ID=CAMNT_0002684279 /DNA_START=34 /DNA_END=471 /DNA_ORIENTATION=+
MSFASTRRRYRGWPLLVAVVCVVFLSLPIKSLLFASSSSRHLTKFATATLATPHLSRTSLVPRAAAAAGGEAQQPPQADGANVPAEAEAEPERGAAYYAGMFTSPAKPEDAEKDMLTPNLKLAGVVIAFCAAIVLGFMGANGLLF